MGGDYGMVVAALCCLALAYASVHRLRAGWPRLLVVLPVLLALFRIPWAIQHCHLRSILSFAFFWVCPSKLLLLCWDAGIDYPAPGLLYFCTVSLLPIRVSGPKPKYSTALPARKRSSLLKTPCQFIAFVAILNAYAYRESLSIPAMYALYCLHIYLSLDLIFGGIAALASAVFGVQCDAPSNNPLLSSSLSEFWGRKWNLVVTTILRSTVYDPILLWMQSGPRNGVAVPPSRDQDGSLEKPNQDSRQSNGSICRSNGSSSSSGHGNISGEGSFKSVNRCESSFDSSMINDASSIGSHSHGCDANAIGKSSLMARLLALMATFTVSGLVHELIFFCINGGRYATGEVTAFFLVHAAATAAEVSLRRILPPHLRLPRPLRIALTMAFLYITTVWLFMPHLIRGGADLETIAEYHQLQAAVLQFITRKPTTS